MKTLHRSYLINKEIKTFLENKFTTKENTNIDHNNKSISYYKLPYIVLIQTVPKKIMSYVKHFAKTPMLNYFFTIQIAGPIFLKRLFASCSEVLCCVQIYLCRMSILSHWRNQMPFTNKDQGTSAN